MRIGWVDTRPSPIWVMSLAAPTWLNATGARPSSSAASTTRSFQPRAARKPCRVTPAPAMTTPGPSMSALLMRVNKRSLISVPEGYLSRQRARCFFDSHAARCFRTANRPPVGPVQAASIKAAVLIGSSSPPHLSPRPAETAQRPVPQPSSQRRTAGKTLAEDGNALREWRGTRGARLVRGNPWRRWGGDAHLIPPRMPRSSGRGGGTSRLRGTIGLLRSRVGNGVSPPRRKTAHTVG